MKVTIPGNRKLILASASPRRRAILAGLGLNPVIDPSSAAEPSPKPGEAPSRYALRVARHKSRDVSRRHNRALVIGADTIVIAGDLIMGKPSSKDEARRMLRSLSGRWHDVITGICMTDSSLRRSCSAYSSSRVHWRRMSNAEIEWYIATGEFADKAGAYAIQGYGSLFVDRIEGDYFNIVGFPIVTFVKLCKRLGVNLFQKFGN
jgi:septum formation protein